MIPDVLHSIRTLINVSANCTPHNVYFINVDLQQDSLLAFYPRPSFVEKACWKMEINYRGS